MAPVIVSPSGKHTATLIFLHGLGDTGHGWASSLGTIHILRKHLYSTKRKLTTYFFKKKKTGFFIKMKEFPFQHTF